MEEAKEKTEKKPVEEKKEEKIETKAEAKPEIKEKKETKKKVEGTAIVHGKDLGISTKQSIALCNFVRGKEPHYAIALLEKVLNKKIAVPMRGEIPHRKNMPKGKVSGRYPMKASKIFIKLLGSLIANANVKNLDIEHLRISLAKANKASRPHKPTRMAYGRKRFKRTHVVLEARTLGEKK